MSFLDFVDKLRQQPEPVRRLATLVTTCVIVGLILVFWLINLKVRSADDTTSSSPTPIQVLKDSFYEQ